MHLLRHLLIPFLLLLVRPPLLDRLHPSIPLRGLLGFQFLLDRFGGLLVSEEGHARGVGGLARGGAEGGAGGVPLFAWKWLGWGGEWDG